MFVCLFLVYIYLFFYIYIYIYIFLSVYIFFFFYIFITMLLIGHDLHHNCELCVISVFNLFEHSISLEIPVFYSCVGLERLHLFDSFFTCTLT
jgi:hypothetical protein